MCARIRLSQEQRKEEILKAGMKLFKEKGFVYTTMEDIIKQTTLSKGGVYYYYKNTIDILHDLMLAGIMYRMNVIKSTVNLAEKCDELSFMAEKMVEKIVDDNPYMDIYVQFLLAKRTSNKLEELFIQLQQKTLEEFQKEMTNLPKVFNAKNLYDFVTHYINSLIIGAEVLNARDSFIENRKLLVEMTKIILKGET